jgi:hypothetical protein
MSQSDLTKSALSGKFDLSPVNLDAPIDLRRSKRAQRSVARQNPYATEDAFLAHIYGGAKLVLGKPRPAF